MSNDHESRTKLAFETHKAEMLSLTSWRTVNVDIPTALSTAFGVRPRMQAHREEIVTQLPKFNIARFDTIQSRGEALLYTNATHLSAAETPDEFQQLVKQVTDGRDALRAVVSGLQLYGILHPDTLKQCARGISHRGIATEAQTLAVTMSVNWARVQSNCPSNLAEILELEGRAVEMLHRIGMREQVETESSQDVDLRSRAFTLFMDAYDDARRAIQFIRWYEGDADEIAPSLYPGAKGHKKAARSDAAKNSNSTTPTQGSTAAK